MVQRRGGAGLLFEAREAVSIVGDPGRQNLDRDLASELRVPGLPDLSHASGAERREDFVRTQAASGCERQAGIRIYPLMGVRSLDKLLGCNSSAEAKWMSPRCQKTTISTEKATSEGVELALPVGA